MSANSSCMTISPPSPSPSYASSLGKARSLLARRSSRRSFTSDDTLTSEIIILPHDTTFLSDVKAAGTSTRAPRPSLSALSSFAPLTPIAASPRMTPDLGPGPGPAALAHLANALDASDSVRGSIPVSREASPRAQYLHVPHVVRVPDHTRDQPEASTSMPPPSWTSTPPTPPLKGVSSSRAESPESAGVVRKRSRSRPGHIRPASVAVFPEYRPPSPPPLTLIESAPAVKSSSSAAPRSLSATGPRKSLSEDGVSADLKRRRTVPRNFGKLSPSVPTAERSRPGSSRSRENMGLEKRGEGEDMLPPSLSRQSDGRGRNDDRSPLGASVLTREDSVGSGRCRAKFTLDDGDASEGENEGEDGETPSSGTGGESVEDGAGKAYEEERELHRERERVGLRRYHALMELLTTEVGYLMDLRVLVTIYLAHLSSLYTHTPSPTLSRPSPSSLSISSLSRSRLPSSRSSTIIYPSAFPGPALSDCPSAYFDKYGDTSVDRDPEKGKSDKEKARRPVFSEADLHVVRRNAEELLQLHQRFLDILREKLEPLGYGSAFAETPGGRERHASVEDEAIGLATVHEAVEAVAEVFGSEMLSFQLYESFCPGHSEAIALVRNLQERYPVEWDAYEQRCSLRVAYEFELAVQSAYPTPSRDQLSPLASPASNSSSDALKRKRRHSTSSVNTTSPQPAFSAVPPSSSHLNVMSPNKSDPTGGHKRKGSGSSTIAPTGGTGQAGRLKFLDYLIKPVQRICKYPLLLDQLRAKRKQQGAEPELGAIESAYGAMRAVVAQVDRASERQTHQVRSALIVSRLVPSSASSPTSSEGPEERCAQITAEFLHSLGVCLLAGALEVIYPQSSGGLRGKYLAAFLYVGGYLVLAKIPKGGKVYEPRHWFTLGGFEIVDEEEDDAALPYAFHLLSPGYHLHLATACQTEKAVWMATIQDARSMQSPEWTNEPVPCLPADDRQPLSATEEFPPDWSAQLPTIQSMSEMETTPNPDSSVLAPPAPSPRKVAKTISRADGMREYQLSALNRRTSTSSVKAFFAPLSFDSRITRPSSQIRQQVDQGLHDVFSETFVTIRSQALLRDEELFQLRRKPANMSRSNSGLSISGAFTTRRRHDSAIVLSSRRKGSLDGASDILGDPELGQRPPPALLLSKRSRSKSGVAKRRGKLPLSVVPSQSSYVDGDAAVVQSPGGSAEAPSPLTQCSSTSSSNPGSTLPSPMDLTIPLPIPPQASGHIRPTDCWKPEYRPKRARSMVDNVKHFFHTRSLSPSPSNDGSPHIPVVSLDIEADPPGGFVQWWRRGSLRRRVQSFPEVPMDDPSPAALTPASSEDSHISKTFLSTSGSAPTHDETAANTTPSRPPHRRVAFSDALPVRRRTLLGFSRSDLRSSRSTESTLLRSKTLKNIFLFQRSNSFTRTPDSDSQTLLK